MDRRRAPAREGTRTTLKVPDDVLASAREVAAEIGTTVNDAVVRLAQEGMEARRRRARASELAEKRRAEVRRVGVRDTTEELPDADEFRAAMLSGRAGE